MRLDIKSESAFLISFGLAKLIAFIGPFWIASNTSIEFYGTIEFALNLAVWTAMILGLGVSGSIPLRVLEYEDGSVIKAVSFFIFVVSLLGLVTGAVGSLFFDSLLIVLCGLLTVTSSFQQAVAAYLRAMSFRKLTPWVENFSINSAVLSVFVSYYIGGRVDVDSIKGIYAICLAICLTSGCFLLVNYKGVLASYFKSIELGVPMLINGLVMLAACNSGRLYIGVWLGMSEVAIYSFAFRISGVLLVLYQMINLRYFKRLYLASSESIGKAYFSITAFLSLVGSIMILAYYFWGQNITPEVLPFNDLLLIIPIITTHTLLWILTAMLELRINRYGLSNKSFKFLIAIPFVLCVAFFIFDDVVNLLYGCFILWFGLVLVLSIQILLLKKEIKIDNWVLSSVLIAHFPLMTMAIK